VAGLPGQYTVVRCTTCGLMRTDPRPTPASMKAFYPNDYGPYAAEIGSGSVALRDTSRRRRLGLGAQHVPPLPPGRMLELGCASGNFMTRMKKAGWQVDGIEFSATAAEVAQRRGFRVVEGTVETAPEPAHPYDLIVAWMVLEHLHEPVETLKRLKGWTRPGGYLVLSVPDAQSLERKLFGDANYALQIPTHLYHYSKASITKVLRASGWEPDGFFWQPNSVNLLRSLEFKFGDWGMQRASAFTKRLATAPQLARGRMVLGWALARIRQSGRMEVWARPIDQASASSTTSVQRVATRDGE
jgi:SAM-dependent methyltransferase